MESRRYEVKLRALVEARPIGVSTSRLCSLFVLRRYRTLTRGMSSIVRTEVVLELSLDLADCLVKTP